MKVAASVFLILLFIPLFLIGALASTVRFQILDANFWLGTFAKNNVYESLASEIKNYADNKTVSGGGSKSDAAVLTNLITPQNVQDGISRNLINLLRYANGEARELDVYIPFNKLPKDLLPTTFDEQSNTIPLTVVLSSLNIKGIDKSQLNAISGVGFWSWALLVIDLLLIFIILTLLFLLTDRGKKFWNIGCGLLLSGLVILAVYVFGGQVQRSMVSSWPSSSEPSQRVLAIFIPFILKNILSLWLIIGLTSVTVGILLFFLARPMYNKR